MLRRGSMTQLLAAPVLEEPEDELLGVEVEVLAAVLGLASVELLLEPEDAVDDELSLELSLFLAPPLLLYRSAYQPPPLRMKPAPPDTWRLAVAW